MKLRLSLYRAQDRRWRLPVFPSLVVVVVLAGALLVSPAAAQAASPTVAGVSPSSGPQAGGTSVTITGSGFTASTGASFGSTPATNFTVVNDTMATATSPAGSGTVDVTVTGGPNGPSAPNPPGDQFTYNPPPAVTGVGPTSGPQAGGTSVTITGSGFTGATSVDFGSTPAESYTVNSDTQITATSPAGTGTVDITVTTPSGGTSATSSGDRYTFIPPPTVTGVSPSSGPQSGGTSVTITGSRFSGVTSVDFGSTPATNVTFVNDSEITATAPAGSGTVDVTVTTPYGTSGTSSSDHYSYVPPAPVVTGVNPSSGPSGGGTSVTISGSGFTGTTSVDFGSTPAESFMVHSDSSITATSPAGSGTVDVTVTTPSGGTSTSNPNDDYTYNPPPTVTGVSPSSGPQAGGTPVTITGTGFTGSTGANFGSTQATNFTVVNDTTATATSPAGTGTVDVTVTGGPNGPSTANPPGDQFTYNPPPTVSSVSPSSGPQSGGTNVTISGSGFTGSTGANFGSNPATNFHVVNDTTITATSPAGTGTVDVTVTGGPNGPSTANPPGDQFTYNPPPTVSSVSPSSGPQAGGTPVTITGTGFTGSTGANFGPNPATNFHVVNDTTITATSPAGSGIVDVTVTGGPNGPSTANPPGDQFSYNGSPTVTSVNPPSGPESGGTTVTITGTGFTGATAVHFGPNAATSYTVNSDTQITATSPAGTGTVHVTVTTPSRGTSPPSSNDQFTYVAPPTNTGAPTISGNPQPGNTLSCSQGSWTGSGNTYTYQWNRDGSPIAGANGSQYVVQPADVGHSLSCTVTATNEGGSASATSAPVNVPGPSTASPKVVAFTPLVEGKTGAGLTGEVNPQGLPTTAYYVYGLDARYQQFGITIYNLSTSREQMGSDFSSHALSQSIGHLLPNALYHVRLVAFNGAGTTVGPDETLKTPAGHAPGPPVLGRDQDIRTASGVVYVVKHGDLVPLTENTQLPSGTVIDALQGSTRVVAASGIKGKDYTGTFGGAVFKLTQTRFGANKGLTTVSIVENAFAGAPSYAACTALGAADAKATVVQTMHADASGLFRARGRYAASTGHGGRWTTTDRCNGTLIAVQVHAVEVSDLVQHITVLVHAGHHYLALAHPKKKKHKKH